MEYDQMEKNGRNFFFIWLSSLHPIDMNHCPSKQQATTDTIAGILSIVFSKILSCE